LLTINNSITGTNQLINSSNTLLTTINQGIGNNYVGNVYGNVLNNVNLAANTVSSVFTWTRGTYKRNSVLMYQDTSFNNTDSISFFTTENNGITALFLGSIYPLRIGTVTFRYASANFNLLPFNSLSIRNNSSAGITNVYATLSSA
jgi:hypothetical protein